jgi:hypothetical protein
MDVVVVRDADYAVALFRRQHALVCDRAAERANASSAQRGERRELAAILGTHGQHFVELEIRNRRREHAPARWRVFDAAHADLEVAALHRLIDVAERDLHELRPLAESLRDLPCNFDVESAQLRGIARIGLHERRAPLGIAAPAEDGLLRVGRRGEEDCEEGDSAHFARR